MADNKNNNINKQINPDMWKDVLKSKQNLDDITRPQKVEYTTYAPPTGNSHTPTPTVHTVVTAQPATYAPNNNTQHNNTPNNTYSQNTRAYNTNMPNPATYTPSPAPMVNPSHSSPVSGAPSGSPNSPARNNGGGSSPAQSGPKVNSSDMSSYTQYAVNNIMKSNDAGPAQGGYINAAHHDFTTARQVVKAARSNADVDGNYIAEERRSIDKNIAVMSLVVGDYDRHAATSAVSSFNATAASYANTHAKADKLFGTDDQIRSSANASDIFKQKSEYLAKNISDRDEFINSVMQNTIVNKQGFTLQTGTDNAYAKMQTFASKGNWQGIDIGNGGKAVTGAQNFGSFSRAELNDIAKTGGFTRGNVRYTYANNGQIGTIRFDNKNMVTSAFQKEVDVVKNGKTVRETVGELDNIRDLAKNAILQQNTNNQILQAAGNNSALSKSAGVTSSVGAKAGSAKQAVAIKQAYIKQLGDMGINMKVGDTREINKAIAGIKKQMKAGVISQAEGQKQLNAIALFKQSGLSDVNIAHGNGLTMSQKRGLDIVVGSVLGSDIQTGARTTYAVYKGARAAVGITDRAIGAIVFGGKNRELKIFGRNITVAGHKVTVGGHFHKALGKAGEKVGDTLVNNTVGRLVEKTGLKPGFKHSDLNAFKRKNIVGNRMRNENLRRQEMGTLKWGKEKLDRVGVKARRVHRSNAEKRLIKSQKKLDELRKTAKTQSDFRKITKMQKKITIKQRGGRLRMWKDNHKVLISRLSRIKNKVTGAGKKVFKTIISPFKAIADLKKKIMSWLMEHVFSKLIWLFGWIALILLLIIFIVVIVIPVISTFLIVILFFISDILNGTDLAGSMTTPDYQYVQYIIDNTITSLGSPLMDVLENDVKRHVMAVMANDGVDPDAEGIYGDSADADIGEMENPNYDWYRKINGGEIGSIHASETGEELPGIMANLEPIVSMMHFRMYEELTMIDWPQCEAYVFYLFVKSHNLDPDEPYDLRVEDDCATDAIYDHAITLSNRAAGFWEWDADSHTLDRFKNGNKEQCENVYLHGYSVEYAKAIFKAYCDSTDFLTDPSGTLQYWLEQLSIDVEPSEDALHAQGVFKDEVPYDSKGECDSYVCVKFGNNANELEGCYESYTVNWEEGGDSYDLNQESGCPGYEHQHGDDCYETDSFFVADGDDYDLDDGWSETGTEYGQTDDDGNVGKVVHVKKMKCKLLTHVHTPWSSETSPGCWSTAYICRGHCGGHITPIINIAVDYDFSTLETLDSFRVTRPLAASEVQNVVDDFVSSKLPTLQEWKAYWELKIFSWFLPWPSTPLAFYELCAKFFALAAATVIDAITGAIGGFISWISGTPTSSDLQGNEAEEGEEIYDFDGWYEDGRPDVSTDLTAVEIAEYWKPYERYTDDLKSLYGEMDTMYEEGYSNWEDFEIIFPMAMFKQASTEDITKVLTNMGTSNDDIQKAIKGDFEGISDSHAKTVAVALSRVGKFYYSLTATGHHNGLYGDSGPADCSGFVAGTLRLAYGSDNWAGWNAASFASHANTSTLTPGCVMSHSNGGRGRNGVSYSGHVVIYVGKIDGVDYIVDCTSTKPGGSQLRAVNISKYPNWYDPG